MWFSTLIPVWDLNLAVKVLLTPCAWWQEPLSLIPEVLMLCQVSGLVVVSYLGSHVAMPGEQQHPLQDGSAKKKSFVLMQNHAV